MEVSELAIQPLNIKKSMVYFANEQHATSKVNGCRLYLQPQAHVEGNMVKVHSKVRRGQKTPGSPGGPLAGRCMALAWTGEKVTK